MSARKFFITGTDTGIGKTVAALTLIEAIKQQGFSVAGFKPVAAGAELENGRLVNQDALQLQQAATKRFSYEQVNPFLFEEYIAPHIAAEKEGVELTVQRCLNTSASLVQSDAEFIVIEGAGGWLVPLNASETFADLAGALCAEVVLVVGLKLGCINHALLTASAIRASGCRLVGWMANHLSVEMAEVRANIEALKRRLELPLVAEIQYDNKLRYSELARGIDLSPLING